jgi:hypothetical protein
MRAASRGTRGYLPARVVDNDEIESVPPPTSTGALAAGDYLVLPTVGAGRTWGAVSCTWLETPAGREARQRLEADAELGAAVT